MDLEKSKDGIIREWIDAEEMPEFAVRIKLEITDIRVEILNVMDILDENPMVWVIQFKKAF